MWDSRKIYYYGITLIITFIVFIFVSEQNCNCNCNTPKYGIKSYLLDEEYTFGQASIESYQDTNVNFNTTCIHEKYYRLPIEAFVVILFFIFMTGYIVF